MSRQVRLAVFAVAAASVAALLAVALLGLPHFGQHHHPYRTAAVKAAIAHRTANAVSAVNFDSRGLDTLGEESILLGSAVGVAALLRISRDEAVTRPAGGGRVLESTGMAGVVALGVTIVVGFNVVAHGHLTPGGGFQGGVVLATGFHLLYVAGRYQSLERLRPAVVFEVGEAAGAIAFAGIGIAGLIATGSFLTNFLGWGTFGDLFSAGTVPILNIAVGVEVASGIVILLTRFLEQDLTIAAAGGAPL